MVFSAELFWLKEFMDPYPTSRVDGTAPGLSFFITESSRLRQQQSGAFMHGFLKPPGFLGPPSKPWMLEKLGVLPCNPGPPQDLSQRGGSAGRMRAFSVEAIGICVVLRNSKKF